MYALIALKFLTSETEEQTGSKKRKLWKFRNVEMHLFWIHCATTAYQLERQD